MIYNEDCIEGMTKHFESRSVDLIIGDPPYGIAGNILQKHYARDDDLVIPGYVEIPAGYDKFSNDWIKGCERILKLGGTMYVISGWTHFREVLKAIASTNLRVINHIVWRYNFGVYTTKKYVSSHYYIVFCQKLGKTPTFNTFSRVDELSGNDKDTKKSYRDRISVFNINRENKLGQVKYQNTLPTALVKKLIQYSSNKGDIVFDPFLGGFTTAIEAQKLNRIPAGFEINEHAYNYYIKQVKNKT